MRLKSSKAEITSNQIIMIGGLLIGILVLVLWLKADSGVLSRFTGIFGFLSDCGKCGAKLGYTTCAVICVVL